MESLRLRVRKKARVSLSNSDSWTDTLPFSPHFPSTSFPSASHSSQVFLEIDNRQCVQDSDQCFKNTDAAAALLASHAIQGTLSYPLVSVVSE